jgi:hypothetical protein
MEPDSPLEKIELTPSVLDISEWKHTNSFRSGPCGLVEASLETVGALDEEASSLHFLFWGH